MLAHKYSEVNGDESDIQWGDHWMISSVRHLNWIFGGSSWLKWVWGWHEEGCVGRKWKFVGIRVTSCKWQQVGEQSAGVLLKPSSPLETQGESNNMIGPVFSPETIRLRMNVIEKNIQSPFDCVTHAESHKYSDHPSYTYIQHVKWSYSCVGWAGNLDN